MSKALTHKGVTAVLIIALALCIGFSVVSVAGAIGTNPVENYVPAVKFNAGLYSALPIQTTSSITAASSAISGSETVGNDLDVTDDATVGGDLAVTGTVTVTGESNLSTLVHGGGSVATTTNAAGTFTAAQVCDNSLIVATPNVGAVTLTFPTTAQLVADCLPTVGDRKTLILRNATTTTDGNGILTLADGANGIHLEQEGATTLVDGNEWAEITFLNVDGTNHMMLVTILQDAD